MAVKPKTAADRKAAQRARQDVAAKEKEKATNRAAVAAHRSNQDLAAKWADKAAAQAGMAVHRSNQDLAAKEADTAAARARMAPQHARKTTKLTKYDGLHSKEVLEGSFHVPALERFCRCHWSHGSSVSLLHEWQDTDTLLPTSGSGICQPVPATQQGGRI